MNEKGLSKAESIILSFAALLFSKRGYPPTKMTHKTYLFGVDHDMAPSPAGKNIASMCEVMPSCIVT